jgi:Glycosyl transferase family 2
LKNFISIVGVIQAHRNIIELKTWLSGLYVEMKINFSDYEFILVNNHCDQNAIDEVIKGLEEDLRKHIFLLNLSVPVDKNNALLAGLDRANGDYTAIFEFDFADKPELITQMWQKSQGKYDIVYLQAKELKQGIAHRILNGIFHGILQKYSNLRIDARAHHTRIISRRALNSLLRLRENSRYLKAIYSLIGYNTTFIEVSEPLLGDPETSFRDQVRTSLVAITSFTTFLRSMLLWVFLLSCVFAAAAVYNAVKVKLTGIDIFGEQVQSLSGWAFLVVLMSVFFAITCLNLYIMSIYLSNIYAEIKNRPLYIIESVKRF